jgi:hypothetical protein
MKMFDTEEYYIYLQYCREYEERPLPLADWRREKSAVQSLPVDTVYFSNHYEPVRDYSVYYSDQEWQEWAEF